MLWALVLLEGVILIAVMRQVGSLLLRVGSIKALDAGTGPPLGAPAPWVPAGSNGQAERIRVLAFLSTHCGACDDVVPALNAVSTSYRDDIEVLTVISDTTEEIDRWMARVNLRVPLINSGEAFETYEIDSTPYAFVISRDGLVEARGGINHIEHVEALIRGCIQSEDQKKEGDDVEARVG